MLKPLGGEGAPFKAVGEWLVPLVTVKGTDQKEKTTYTEYTQGNHNQVPFPLNLFDFVI